MKLRLQYALGADAVHIEIQAQNQIICNQNENFCTAEGDAVSTQDNLIVRAETLRVLFSSVLAAAFVSGFLGDTKRTPIWFEVEGNFYIILGENAVAIEQKAAYALFQEIFTLSE